MDLGVIVSLTRLVNIVNIQSYQRKRPVTVFPVQRDVIPFHEPQVHFPRKPLYLPRGFVGMCAPALHIGNSHMAVEVSNRRRIIRGCIAKTWIAGRHDMEDGSTRAKKLDTVWNRSGRSIQALTSPGDCGQ